MMRQALSVILALAIVAPVGSGGPDTPSVTTQVLAMPLGTQMELRLKTKERIRGDRGAASNIGFALLDKHARERQIAFDDVVSVRQLNGTSHLQRNILIGVGIAVGATVVLVIAYAVALGKLGRST
jgi:hypothetical protein